MRLRPLLVGLGLSLVVATYSIYAGLKAGGVYWPILTATLVAMGLLRATGGATRQEISVAGTAASTGGLLAAGVLFTLPALSLLGVAVTSRDVFLVALVGGLLGVGLSIPLRAEMIERLALPYPDGTATARLVEAGDEGGRKVKTLLAAAAGGGLFAALRDGFHALPAVINLESLRLEAARRFSFGGGISLVGLAGGFLIGPLFTGAWFAGGVVSYLVTVPWLVASGRFADKGSAIATLTRPFGVGVIVGASLLFFFAKGLPSLTATLRDLAPSTPHRRWALALGIAAGVAALGLALELPLWLAAVTVVAAFVVATIAARIAGELNIDPMEIFAIAVLLIVLVLVKLPPRSAVLFAAVLAIAAGMAGDFMQDLKAGHLLGTRPGDQVRAQLLSVVTSAACLAFVLPAVLSRFTIGSPELPAPQAVALAAIVRAGEITGPLAWGGLAGAALTAVALWRGWGLLPVAFGIGLYAPIELSLPLFLGGLARAWADRRGETEPGRLVAAGLIAGEGLIGVALALAGFAGWL